MTSSLGEVRRSGIGRVFLPFAAGYLLSYLFRTVNGPIGDRLIAEFHLNAAQLGLLTSAYFLTFSAFQLPLGILIDHFGPRRVQLVLCLVAACGALLFAVADNTPTLIAGRALIGLGTAGGLVAGLKALNSAVPHERLLVMNGFYVMCGGIGAMAGTYPVSWATAWLGWRGTFVLLAGLTFLVSLAMAGVVPERQSAAKPEPWRETLRALGGIARTAAFWRLAPLSASVIGTAFAVHGLWAARWMSDVDGMARQSVTFELLAMGAGLTIGAATLGLLANRLRQHGVSMSTLFGGACATFLLIQIMILIHTEIPELVLWTCFAVFGAMTVLSYSMLADLFESGLIGRANSALNVLHLTAAFVLQLSLGAIANHWAPNVFGQYPIVAYRAAFALPIALQVLALGWFVLSPVLLASRLETLSEAEPAG